MNPESASTPGRQAPADGGVKVSEEQKPSTLVEAPTTTSEAVTRLQVLGFRGPPKPPGGTAAVSAPEYDHRDTFWIREDTLGPIVDGLDASRVTTYAFGDAGASKIATSAIPESAQLLIVHGPLSHEAGRKLTVRSFATQEILFDGELRYPIDLPPDEQVLLLLATPDEVSNKHITEPQIYPGRLVSQYVGRELEEYIRRELPLGEENLQKPGAGSAA